MPEIVHKEKYVDDALLGKITSYYRELNDILVGGPVVSINPISANLPKEGCSDRPLRLEYPDNPIHELIDQLKADFGDFHIHTASIRYLYFPYGPHSDVKSSEQLIKARRDYRHGYTFIIPLSWKEGYTPGTAFFDSPPKEDQPLMAEHQDVLPKLQKETANKNYGVKKMITWKSPGDLIAWMNFQYHCTMVDPNMPHNDKEWCKEFISIETYRFREE